MKINDIVKYIGSGFIGFDPSHTEMKIVAFEDRYEVLIEYKGSQMLVRRSEIAEL